MRRIKLVPIILLAVPTLFACNKPTPTPIIEYCTVTYHGNGGTVSASSAEIRKNAIFKEENTVNATKEGYAFKEWTFDQQGTNVVPDDYKVTSAFEVYAQYRASTLTMANPDDGEIVCYGSTAVEYFDTSASSNEIIVSISPSNAMTYEFDTDGVRTWLNLDAKDENIEASVTVTISNGVDSDCKTIFIHHPRTPQEAGEAIDFAIGRKIYNVTLTFDYDNQEDFVHFYQNRIECVNAVPSAGLYYWNKGINKTNRFVLYAKTTMATKYTDISLPQYSEYYCENVKNGAYEIRRQNIVKRDDDHFFIDDAKKRLVVHNTETLFFALERGFRPVFDDNDTSIMAIHAKQVYQKAREWCNEAFGKETTSPFMKMRQIFEYMTSHIHYDYWITSAPDRPESGGYEWMSYSPEGVFLNNGVAVCDGFSKAFAIMCGIEGLPVVRCAGFPDVEGLAGHAWNYYKYTDDIWYLVCPTWGQDCWGSGSGFDYNFATVNYTAFMAESKYFKNTTYRKKYYECRMEGKTEAQAIAEAEEASKLMDFSDDLFSNLTKSSEACFDNIYQQDSYAADCDYDIDSETEAVALANAMSFLNEDFTVDLSVNSWIYFEDQIIAAMQNKFPSASIDMITDTSLMHTTLCVDF